MPAPIHNPTVKRWNLFRLLFTLVICAVGWLIVLAGCVCVGSTTTHLRWPQTTEQFQYRLEIALVASLVGAALSSAGVIYQAILRNPLADPYLLGVSSGASLAAFIWRFLPLALLTNSIAPIGQQLFAFAGAMSAMAIVFILSMRRGRLEPITLLLVGVIVNSINGSIFLLLNTLNRDITGGSGGPLTFLVGGIQTSLTLTQESFAGIVAGLCWAVLIYLSGQLNVAMLGEAEAASLGIQIHRLRWIVLLTASLMTAAVVAISGPIAFIGLICPHVARMIVGNDQRRLLPVATALGAILLAVADATSRQLANASYAQTILPVGVLTGLLGGPFYLVLLYNARKTAIGNHTD